MHTQNIEKIWLSHYIAGIATADWLIGVPERRFKIDLAQMLATLQEDPARKVWLLCRTTFVFSPTRFIEGELPGPVAVASLAKSFSGLAGAAALANLFGKNKLPPTAHRNVWSDLQYTKLQWRAVTVEDAYERIFERVLESTFALFRLEQVRDCVNELAARICKCGKLENKDGGLDKWFEDRLLNSGVTWAQFMPVEEVHREVLTKFHMLRVQEQAYYEKSR